MNIEAPKRHLPNLIQLIPTMIGVILAATFAIFTLLVMVAISNDSPRMRRIREFISEQTATISQHIIAMFIMVLIAIMAPPLSGRVKPLFVGWPGETYDTDRLSLTLLFFALFFAASSFIEVTVTTFMLFKESLRGSSDR